ncbi:MAG: PD-(D/E)XK nuclease family protein [archaeon]
MKLYSHSRLWLFENCPEAYKIKYLDKTFPDLPTSINLVLGSAVHDSLEELYKRRMAGVVWELDELVRHFALLWKEECTSDVRVDGGTAEDYFNKGLKFLADYYMKHHPFSDDTMEVEKRLVFPLDDIGEIRLQGYVDRLVKVGWKDFEIHDYKTNAIMKKQEEVDADKQLAFYHIGLQKLFGADIKVKLVWHFLAHNRSISSTRTQEQLDKLKRNTLRLIREIESNTVWPACGRSWCDWCDYKRKNGLTMENGKYNQKVVGNGNLGKWV